MKPGITYDIRKKKQSKEAESSSAFASKFVLLLRTIAVHFLLQFSAKKFKSSWLPVLTHPTSSGCVKI